MNKKSKYLRVVVVILILIISFIIYRYILKSKTYTKNIHLINLENKMNIHSHHN